jgi:hypothetical protein
MLLQTKAYSFWKKGKAGSAGKTEPNGPGANQKTE